MKIKIGDNEFSIDMVELMLILATIVVVVALVLEK